LEEAKNYGADLIVMGTHGRRGLARLALGSDAQQVVQAAVTPVLVVRASKQGDSHISTTEVRVA
jgi:nucleotide-binding universal stress UspA family protein